MENHTHREIIPPSAAPFTTRIGNVLAQTQRVYDVRLDGPLEATIGDASARDRRRAGRAAGDVHQAFNPKNRAIPLATRPGVDDPVMTGCAT